MKRKRKPPKYIALAKGWLAKRSTVDRLKVQLTDAQRAEGSALQALGNNLLYRSGRTEPLKQVVVWVGDDRFQADLQPDYEIIVSVRKRRRDERPRAKPPHDYVPARFGRCAVCRQFRGAYIHRGQTP